MGPRRGGPASLHPFADDPRAAEYVEPQVDLGRDDPLGQAAHEHMYDRHHRFFAEELPAWAVETLGVSDDPNNVVLTGFSASAALAVSLGKDEPQRYAGVVAVSIAGLRAPQEEGLARSGDSPARPLNGERFFIACGAWEGLLHQFTGEWAGYLHGQGAQVRRLTPAAAHDPAVWELALHEALPWLLPPQ